jgi:hypothetical protein
VRGRRRAEPGCSAALTPLPANAASEVGATATAPRRASTRSPRRRSARSPTAPQRCSSLRLRSGPRHAPHATRTGLRHPAARKRLCAGFLGPARRRSLLAHLGVVLLAEARPAVRPAPDKDPPNYPIADAIASQNTVKSPPNGARPCWITCSSRKFPWASNVATIERNPTSFTRVLL